MWEESLALHRELERRADAAKGLLLVAQAHGNLRNYGQARQLLERALVELQAVGDQRGVADARSTLGSLLRSMGRLDEARTCLERALQENEAIGYRTGAALVRRNLGVLSIDLGRYEEAIELLGRARKELSDAGDGRGAARCLIWIGASQIRLGQLDAAAESYGRGRKALEAVADRGGVSWALYSQADVARLQGRYAEALGWYERARSISEELKNQSDVASIDSGIADVHVALGRYGEALRILERVLEEHERRGDRVSADRTMLMMGPALQGLGEPARAIRLLEQCLGKARRSGETYPQAALLSNLSNALRQAGDLEKATDCMRRAVQLNEKLGLGVFAARDRARLGSLLFARGEHAEALEALESALSVGQAAGDRRAISSALGELAQARQVLGPPSEVFRLARAALAAQQALDQGLGDDEAPSGVRTARRLSNLGLYEAWRLAPAGPPDAEQRLAEALWFLETGRGQAFARGLLNREALLQAELPRELRAACTAARTRVDAELRRIANRALPGGRDSLDAAYLDLETLNRRIQREAGRVAQLVLPEPVDLAPLRAALPEGSALVLYQLSEDRALVLVVTASSAALLDLGSAKALAEAAESYLRLASAAGGEEGVEAEAGRARQLYDLLLRPLEPALAGARRLLISPDRALSFLSFEALLRADASGPARALERWEMSYVPSGTVLSMLAGEFRDAKRGERLLALGDPHYPGEASAAPTARRDAVLRGFGPLERLPASAEETRAIAALFPEGRSRLLLREDATAAKLTAALAEGGGRLAAVHFACHGFLDPERPRLTGLVLAGGEVLGLDDLYRLRIPADLAVLSACETGKGKLVTGDGVIGLVRGFFFAGVPRVVVSNWKVSDAGTRPLMVAFYREMLERGRAPAAALREAKLAMLRAGGAGARPSAWAAFVLWGLPD